MWYFVVKDFLAREGREHQDEVVRVSCPVGGTPTEEPLCVVLASSLRKNPRYFSSWSGEMSKLMSGGKKKTSMKIDDMCGRREGRAYKSRIRQSIRDPAGER